MEKLLTPGKARPIIPCTVIAGIVAVQGKREPSKNFFVAAAWAAGIMKRLFKLHLPLPRRPPMNDDLPVSASSSSSRRDFLQQAAGVATGLAALAHQSPAAE